VPVSPGPGARRQGGRWRESIPAIWPVLRRLDAAQRRTSALSVHEGSPAQSPRTITSLPVGVSPAQAPQNRSGGILNNGWPDTGARERGDEGAGGVLPGAMKPKRQEAQDDLRAEYDFDYPTGSVTARWQRCPLPTARPSSPASWCAGYSSPTEATSAGRTPGRRVAAAGTRIVARPSKANSYHLISPSPITHHPSPPITSPHLTNGLTNRRPFFSPTVPRRR
jgi:hypothetical protein